MAKSELILAFNEIAEHRKLPRDIIIEALKAALVSAYRRDAGASSAQAVEARVDDLTGEPTVWVEKEVVDEVQSPQTEVTLADARSIYPDVEMGDVVLIDDTPEDFGRIAAQTAKQVILQRMREAEREAQYQEYMDRVGDLVTGTVQSSNSDVVTVGLGRTEAILPRSQQVPGERYRMHDKVRAYVMEVRKSPRGPQIVLSRTHRSMLRRLFEYEVPEIYNGTVEIKSIAREPGARSKVAVTSLQPGADPVGACVGMRGVRIQSIVKELNGEKIDVIEWSPDQAVFISKALSPARVSAVFLDDDPFAGKTATVVVPDDQLSLAIGREGQNARLAAKLTGWRIDIKSVTEAAQDAFQRVQTEEDLADLALELSDTIEKVGAVLEKKAANRPIMPEEFHLLVDFVKQVEGARAAIREAVQSAYRQQLQEARSNVPEAAYDMPLEDTDLPLRVFNLLDAVGYNTVGEVMEQYYIDPDRLTEISGFGPSALDDVQTLIDTLDFPEPEPEPEPALDEVAAEAEAEAAAEEAGEPVAEAEAAVDAELEAAEYEEEAAPPVMVDGVSEEEYERRRRAELVARLRGEAPVEEEVAPGLVVEEPELPEYLQEEDEEEAVPAAEAAAARPALDDEDDFDYGDMDEEEIARERAKRRRRQLVFDEKAGRVVAKRRRKGSRRRDKWLEQWDEIEDNNK